MDPGSDNWAYGDKTLVTHEVALDLDTDDGTSFSQRFAAHRAGTCMRCYGYRGCGIDIVMDP